MVTQLVKETVEVMKRPVAACVHHWVIEPAAGPTSRGFCRLCNETKEFQNFLMVEEGNFGN